MKGPLAISAFTVASAIGIGRDASWRTLREHRSGLRHQRFETATLDSWLGLVDAVDEERLPEALASYDCRNNRLAWLALRSDGFADAVAGAVARHGAGRVGVFIGTSTSGILQTEIAYRHRDPDTGALPADFRYAQTHNCYSVADFTRRALGLQGPAAVVSTACSSSAKVYANAARMLELGLIDAAVVGGVDSMCLTTLYGFNSLELLSPEICRPWDAGRRGLSLGEGAAFSLLEREMPVGETPAAWLLGVGESSDGHHMSSPHPQGAGAIAAMHGALQQAGLAPEAVDYVNLHGTATPANDSSEDFAVLQVFGDHTPCSSTKGATGHTLGAAGAVEAAISILALQHQVIPGGVNLEASDPQLQCDYVAEPRSATLRVVASNSFGFGGSNACLLLGAAA
jgi:3-oxoacyl-[acyl-carrier-protein] synthase I